MVASLKLIVMHSWPDLELASWPLIVMNLIHDIFNCSHLCPLCGLFCKDIVKMTMRIRKSLVSDTQLALEAQILYDDKSVQQVPSKINGVHTGP